MKQLVCKHVTIAYEKEAVVNDLSFQVEEGEYVSIIGENGAGKSTLLKAVLGLIKIRSGEISFENGFKGNKIGYLSQQNPLQKIFRHPCLKSSYPDALTAKGSPRFSPGKTRRWRRIT